jgi:hypothetical protein
VSKSFVEHNFPKHSQPPHGAGVDTPRKVIGIDGIERTIPPPPTRPPAPPQRDTQYDDDPQQEQFGPGEPDDGNEDDEAEPTSVYRPEVPPGCPVDARRAARPTAYVETRAGADRGPGGCRGGKPSLAPPGKPIRPGFPSTFLLPFSNQTQPLLRGKEGKPREADWGSLDRKRRENTSKTAVFRRWWWGMDSNHRTRRGQIYSLMRLATSLPHRGIQEHRAMVERKGFEPSTPTLRT